MSVLGMWRMFRTVRNLFGNVLPNLEIKINSFILCYLMVILFCFIVNLVLMSLFI